MTAEQQQAVRTICGAAWQSCRPDLRLAAFTASQAIFESAYLTRAPGNNCFGIKQDQHGSGVQYILTHEYINGEYRQTPLAFETYASLADCFRDHARLIQSGVYATAWQRYEVDHDIDRFIRAVAAHYATDPAYADKMIAETHSQTVQSALQTVAVPEVVT